MEPISEAMGWFVRSTAGRDTGELYQVRGTQDGLLLLCDGKRRRLSHPKRKSGRQLAYIASSRETLPQTDRALRRALAAFKGGNHAWQRTI